jgi:N-acyl homoserine lactone hydrolase
VTGAAPQADPLNARLEPSPSGPISSVSVVSTGMVQIHPQQPFGTRLPLLAWLIGSRRWTPPLPINAYVIEHRDGLVLFDTGQDRASVTDPKYFPGGATGFLYSRLARFVIPAQDTLVARLAALGHDAADVRLAILSHLHQDHIGGIRYLPNAEFIVADAEWRAMDSPRSEMNGFLRRHIDLPGVRFRRIEPSPTADPALAPFTSSYDVMGDGALVLLPVPGHTPGSMALLVRRPGMAPLLLAGDLTYEAGLLEAGRIPGVGNKAGMRAASALVLGLAQRYPDLVVLPAHDPGAAERLDRANGTAVDELADAVSVGD